MTSQIFFLLLLHYTIAFPIPQHLHPKFPRLPIRPNLSITETKTLILATITHPSLNETSTARVTLSTNPLTVNIEPISGRPLMRSIPIMKTFNNVSIRAKMGAIQLILHKTVQDLAAEIALCNTHSREYCLQRLAERVCQPTHKKFALARLSCDDDCVEQLLQHCQSPDMLAEGAALVTQLIFGCVAAVMIITYGWGFASAIASIPKELATFLSWASDIIQRIRVEGVKLGAMDALMTFV